MTIRAQKLAAAPHCNFFTQASFPYHILPPVFATSQIPLSPRANPKKLETALRANSAGIPYTLLLGIEVVEFPTFWLLLESPSLNCQSENSEPTFSPQTAEQDLLQLRSSSTQLRSRVAQKTCGISAFFFWGGGGWGGRSIKLGTADSEFFAVAAQVDTACSTALVAVDVARRYLPGAADVRCR